MPPDDQAAIDSVARTPALPNLHGIMTWMAREHAPRLSFLDARWTAIEAWKSAARPILRQRLSYDPKPVPLAADLIRREDRDGFTLEVVNLSATPAYDLPARVLIPKPGRGPFPAIVALHCHSCCFTWGHEKILSSPDDPPVLTEFRRGTYGRPWAEALVRRGYLLIVIDAFYFGARRLRVEDLDSASVFPEVRDAFDQTRAQPAGSPAWLDAANRVCAYYEHLTAKTITATGATWPGLNAWDDMRTVDYLASRPDVDPARIGCAGLSGGGLRSALLAAVDPRIKAASVTGWMTEFAHQLRNHVHHTWAVFVPGLYPDLDLPDVAALHAPGALLVQQCRQDNLYPLAGMEAAVEKLNRIYAKAGQPERFRGTFYDAPHCYQPVMQDETFDWFDRWL